MSLSRRSKPPTERMFCRLHAELRSLPQRGDDVVLAETGFGALALHQAEFRLQVRWREPDRRWRNRASGQEFFGDQHACRDRIRRDCLGSSSHALNSRLRSSSARIRARSIWFSIGASSKRALPPRSETLSSDSRCGNREPRISAHARSANWSRSGRCSGARSGRAGHPLPTVLRPVRRRWRNSPTQASDWRFRRR